MKRHIIVSVIGLIIVVGLIVLVFLISMGNAMAHGKVGMMGQTPGSMMGGGMMAYPQMGHSGTSLKRILHVWVRLLFSKKDEFGLTGKQLDEIQSLINQHMKETIRMEAEKKIINIELRELLAKDETDFGEMEKRIKSKSNLKADMDLGGIRTFQKIKDVLSEEQRKKLHASFKPMLSSMVNGFSSSCMMGRDTGMMGPGKGGMMKQGGMMEQEGMMKGMMGKSMMQGQSQTAVSPSSATRTDSQGPVTIKVAFDSQRQTAQGELMFKIEMDTHSVELENVDLGRLSVLRNEEGVQVSPSGWSSPGGGGHHVKGVLTFPNKYGSGKPFVGSNTRYVELVVRDVGEVMERVFRWDLEQ